MNLNQFCALHNLDRVTIDFCIFAIEKGDEYVSFLFNCLEKEQLSKYLKLVVANDDGDGWALRPQIVKLLEQERRKNEGGGFVKLEQKLAVNKDIIVCEQKFGYFFSKKENRTAAKNIIDAGDYDIDKCVKIIVKYYTEWSSEMSPPGLYTLLTSPSWIGLYANYKESKLSNFDEY